MDKKTSLSTIVLLVFGVIVSFLLLSRVDSYLKLKALGDCSMASKYETNAPDGTSKVSYPVEELYKKCLAEKGYRK